RSDLAEVHGVEVVGAGERLIVQAIEVGVLAMVDAGDLAVTIPVQRAAGARHTVDTNVLWIQQAPPRAVAAASGRRDGQSGVDEEVGGERCVPAGAVLRPGADTGGLVES